MSADARPEDLAVIASILAKGYLRYRKSRQNRALEPAQNRLDSRAEPSLHVTVVNAQRTEEN